MFALSTMPESDSLLYSVPSQLLNILILFLGSHLIQFFYLFSLLLSLFDFMIEFALDLGDSSALLFFVENSCSVFTGLDKSPLCFLLVNFFKNSLFMFKHSFLTLHIHILKFVLQFAVEIIDGLAGEEVDIKIVNFLGDEVESFLLSVHFDDPDPLVHLLLGHFVVGLSPHEFLLLAGENIDLLAFVLEEGVHKLGRLLLRQRGQQVSQIEFP